MKRRIEVCFICTLLAIVNFSVVSVAVYTENQNSMIPKNCGQSGDNTLITFNNRVIEVDTTGNIVWQKDGLNGPVDAERLINGHTLITERLGSRVIEVNDAGTIVWQKTGLNSPSDAERLGNGHTLISECPKWDLGRVIEVNDVGIIVWRKTNLDFPIDVERLGNGNTLITETYLSRVIEINTNGNIVWQKTGLDAPFDADRLENGNTLIAEVNSDRVIEVNTNGNIVWQKNAEAPVDVERLKNGHTLIVEYGANRVIEVNSAGTIVWQKDGLNEPFDAERFPPNESPIAPIIDGPANGKVGTKYDYTINTTDPDGDDLSYFVDWDDGTNSGWIGPYHSGEEITQSHTWSKKGTYIIRCMAKDVNGAESDWGTLEVTMPKNKPFIFNFPILNWLFERFPNMFPILRQLLGL